VDYIIVIRTCSAVKGRHEIPRIRQTTLSTAPRLASALLGDRRLVGRTGRRRFHRRTASRARSRCNFHRHRRGLRRRPQRADHRPRAAGSERPGKRERFSSQPRRRRAPGEWRHRPTIARGSATASVSKHEHRRATRQPGHEVARPPATAHLGTRAWNRNPTPFKLLRQLLREASVGLIGISTPEQDQNSVIDLIARRLGRFRAGHLQPIRAGAGGRVARRRARVRRGRDRARRVRRGRAHRQVHDRHEVCRG